MADDDLIVSKTNAKGHVTYVNATFRSISGFNETDIIGRPHSIVRSAAMPRAVFKLLWSRLAEGREVFAYIVNRTKTGGHYWVLAHVTPSRNAAGEVVGYHSTRRKPRQNALHEVRKLYALLLAEEARHPNRKDALVASWTLLQDTLGRKGVDYDEFVLSL
jgi:PAS domain S-box-containing protein